MSFKFSEAKVESDGWKTPELHLEPLHTCTYMCKNGHTCTHYTHTNHIYHEIYIQSGTHMHTYQLKENSPATSYA